jgi:hypothetical protein
VNIRKVSLRSSAALGGVVGYGCLLAFLILVGWQIYHWFHDGEWTHVGVTDALRSSANFCCSVDAGGASSLVRWIESPVTWLGVHHVLELVPASLALFAFSILGNCIFIYSRDKLRVAS